MVGRGFTPMHADKDRRLLNQLHFSITPAFLLAKQAPTGRPETQECPDELQQMLVLDPLGGPPRPNPLGQVESAFSRVAATRNRSPGVIPAAFHAQSPDLRFPYLIVKKAVELQLEGLSHTLER